MTGGTCQDSVWIGYACNSSQLNCTRDNSTLWTCHNISLAPPNPPPIPQSCTKALQKIFPGIESFYIDPDSPNDACVKSLCIKDFSQCNQTLPPKEELLLVFSDEFDLPGRDFSPGRDDLWQALNLNLQRNGEMATFKPEAVTTRDGQAVITVTKEDTKGPVSSLDGEYDIIAPYKSGMMQSWNKFCFKGMKQMQVSQHKSHNTLLNLQEDTLKPNSNFLAVFTTLAFGLQVEL